MSDTNKTQICKTCKPYRNELGEGFIMNANQVVNCFACNPTPRRREINALAQIAVGFEAINRRIAEIAAYKEAN